MNGRHLSRVSIPILNHNLNISTIVIIPNHSANLLSSSNKRVQVYSALSFKGFEDKSNVREAGVVCLQRRWLQSIGKDVDVIDQQNTVETVAFAGRISLMQKL